MKKDTPIGYSDFRQIREENRYYVDKTTLVRPVVKGALITLLCRTPVQNAWLQDYYEEMVGFLRKLLGLALKDNPNLKKGVLTGILRVSKESMFSDLNNFSSSSGLQLDEYADAFGFTEAEVAAMLRHYDLNGRELDDIRIWYDGYRFGGVPIYNPWSVVNYVFSLHHTFQPYWVNTSGNELLKRLFFNQKTDLRPHMEALIRGETLTARLSEHLVFADLDRDETAVLNLLYFAGYLRTGPPRSADHYFEYDLSVPNREISRVYRDVTESWLRNDLQGDLREPLLGALLEGDVLTFEEQLSDFALRVFSFYDADRTRSEHFYHAFLLGLLVRLDTRYVIRSNMENGHGRYDICLIPRDPSRKGVVIEIKSPNLRRGETLEQALTAAVAQMAQQKYDTELSAHGVRDVLRLAVAVSGKDVRVEEV